jgi:hypothetical protein
MRANYPVWIGLWIIAFLVTRIPVDPRYHSAYLCFFLGFGRMARRAYFHFQFSGDVGLGKLARPGHCPAQAFRGTGARISTTLGLQLSFPIWFKVCRYFWLSGSSGRMEGFWRAAHYPVDCVRCASHSWLVCPGRLGGALAKRRDNLLLPRVAMGGLPYSVCPHGLVSTLARAKPHVGE